MVITTETIQVIIMYAVMTLIVIFMFWAFIEAIRTGEFEDMFFGTWKTPWEKEDKKRAKQEAKAKANKKWWEA